MSSSSPSRCGTTRTGSPQLLAPDVRDASRLSRAVLLGTSRRTVGAGIVGVGVVGAGSVGAGSVSTC